MKSVSIALRIGGQVSNKAGQRIGSRDDIIDVVKFVAQGFAVQRKVVLGLFQKRNKRQRADILLHVGLRKCQISFQHGLHILDVVVQSFKVGIVAGQGQLQLESCQNGAQVVAHAVQHSRSLLHLALNALAHEDESETRSPDFVCAAR